MICQLYNYLIKYKNIFEKNAIIFFIEVEKINFLDKNSMKNSPQ